MKVYDGTCFNHFGAKEHSFEDLREVHGGLNPKPRVHTHDVSQVRGA